MKDHYKPSYSIRDNCGFAATELVELFLFHNIQAVRIRGYFKCDIPVHNKKDFTPEMKKEFLQSGKDFNSRTDRLELIKNSSYHEEWLKCPHYWVEADNQVFDPSGNGQFIESGLSSDLHISRYLRS
jgi:hypothetical protein